MLVRLLVRLLVRVCVQGAAAVAGSSCLALQAERVPVRVLLGLRIAGWDSILML